MEASKPSMDAEKVAAVNSDNGGVCPGCIARDKRIAALETLVAKLMQQVREQTAVNTRLSAQAKHLTTTNEKLSGQIEKLTQKIQELERAGKRQAAPFSKGEPKANPKKPGRKAGENYGVKAHRPIPVTPVDEVYDVTLPTVCPHCGTFGSVEEDHIETQHHTDVVCKVVHRRFDVHLGYCRCCKRAVRSRHELQTSDALGAAGSQLGPTVQATLVELNKKYGLSHGKGTQLIEGLSGLNISRGGSAQVILRAGKRAEPIYQSIVSALPKQPTLTPDETGWRVGGHGAWLHVFTNDLLTCYGIYRERGFDAMKRLLDKDYQGALTHDGWWPYDHFELALHQTCLGHLLSRCKRLLETAVGGAVRFPRQVKELLHKALHLRDRYQENLLSRHGLTVAVGRLKSQMDALLAPMRSNPENERLAKHLYRNHNRLFVFLEFPEMNIDATNWRAEQALRPAVVNRKVWGGNRTENGARAQSVLMSVMRTAGQQGYSTIEFIGNMLRGFPPPLRLMPLDHQSQLNLLPATP